MAANMAIKTARSDFESSGYDAIPLYEDSKHAVCEGWPKVSPNDQWEGVGPDFQGNVGLRCGGRLGFSPIDADDEPTVRNVLAYLTGLGLRPPQVQTASIVGRHFHFFSNMPDGPKSSKKLSPAFGEGELRFGRGALVVCPPSIIGDSQYRFLNVATLSELRSMTPFIDQKDLAPLVSGFQSSSEAAFDFEADPWIDAPPFELIHRDLSPMTLLILDELQAATKGQRIWSYPTRSEAVAKIVCDMILFGWSWDEIEAEFDRRMPLILQEKGTGWLKTQVYERTVSYLAATRNRVELAKLYLEINSSPWSGPTGGRDQTVLSGVIAVGWQYDRFQVHVSERDLQTFASIGRQGVHDSLTYLEGAGYLTKLSRGDQELGSRWEIPRVLGIPVGIPCGFIKDSKDPPCPHEHVAYGTTLTVTGSNEIWSYSKLGRSCGMVYRFLGSEPIWVDELELKTGKGRRTINRALNRLNGVGLAESHGSGGWILGHRDLAEVESELGCAEATKKRKERIDEERWAWRERCAGWDQARKGKNIVILYPGGKSRKEGRK